MFKRISIGVVLVGAAMLSAGAIAGATTRQLSVSEPMPELTVQDVKGTNSAIRRRERPYCWPFCLRVKNHPYRP